MEELNKKISKYQSDKLNDTLKRDYIEALKDEKFKSLTRKLKLKDEVGMKYTSKLEHTISNLKNCEKCKNLNMCKNEVIGSVYYPTKNDEKLEFNYVQCKYKNKSDIENNKNKSIVYGLSIDLKNASMADIDINDKKRVELIKWLKGFYDSYPDSKKGLYLHGSFGSGKTYLVAALLNELAKKDYKVVMMYYPEMLNVLKSTFDKNKDDYETDTFTETLDTIKKSDLLLIDDIGAETVTNWSRDEILGTILQYRMEHNLSTFLTSNLNIDELEIHLSLVKNNMDKVKARRIIERIKQLTQDMELISVNRRN